MGTVLRLDDVENEFRYMSPRGLLDRLSETYGLGICGETVAKSIAPLFKKVMPGCQPDLGYSISFDYDTKNPGPLHAALFDDGSCFIHAGVLYVEKGTTGSRSDHELTPYEILELKIRKPLEVLTDKGAIIVPALNVKMIAESDGTCSVFYTRRDHAPGYFGLGWMGKKDAWKDLVPDEWFKKQSTQKAP